MQQDGVVEHVERLDARQAVGPEREPHARREQRGHVGPAHAEVAVAARAQHDVHAAAGEHLAVRGVHLHAVRGDEPRVQDAEAAST